MAPIILRANPSPDDDAWVFNATPPPRKRPDMGLHVSFTPEAIKLDWNVYPSNRILHADDQSKFLLVSFESLRFPEKPAFVTRDYKIRMFKAGFHLNGVEYRFYGHSNSQLVSVSPFCKASLLTAISDPEAASCEWGRTRSLSDASTATENSVKSRTSPNVSRRPAFDDVLDSLTSWHRCKAHWSSVFQGRDRLEA